MNFRSTISSYAATTVLLLLQCNSFAANPVTLTFNEPNFDWLAQGTSASPYHIWTTGDFWTQQFSGTGLNSANRLDLKLQIANDGALASQNLGLNVRVNGSSVGNLTLFSQTPGMYQGTYNFPAIAGDAYEIKLIATSTIADGAGSFSLLIDGPSTATLGFIPEPSAIALAVIGLVAICNRRHKRA